MDRKEITLKIGELENHCEGCKQRLEWWYQYKNNVHLACIEQCEIGRSIRELGEQLSPTKRAKHDLTKERLIEHLGNGMTLKDIGNIYHISYVTVSYYRKKWGVGED